MPPDYNKYRGVRSGPTVFSGVFTADGVSLEELPGQKPLLKQAADAEDMIEKSLASARLFILAVGFCVSATKIGYAERAKDLTSDVQAMIFGAKAVK